MNLYLFILKVTFDTLHETHPNVKRSISIRTDVNIVGVKRPLSIFSTISILEKTHCDLLCEKQPYSPLE